MKMKLSVIALVVSVALFAAPLATQVVADEPPVTSYTLTEVRSDVTDCRKCVGDSHFIDFVEPMQQRGEPQWRGQIEHVGSGEKTHLQVPAPLLEFLTAHLPSPTADEPNDERVSEEEWQHS